MPHNTHESTICARCTLPECDDQHSGCLLQQTPTARAAALRRHLKSTSAVRVGRAVDAVRRQMGAR
jgi:hypothetical protein